MHRHTRDERVVRDRAHPSRLVCYPAYPAWVSFSLWCTKQESSYRPLTSLRPGSVKRCSRLLYRTLANTGSTVSNRCPYCARPSGASSHCCMRVACVSVAASQKCAPMYPIYPLVAPVRWSDFPVEHTQVRASAWYVSSLNAKSGTAIFVVFDLSCNRVGAVAWCSRSANRLARLRMFGSAISAGASYDARAA